MIDDLIHAALESERNRERLHSWQRRYRQITGHYPDSIRHARQRIHGIHFPLCGHWPTWFELRPHRQAPSAGNGHVVRMPHHRGQFRGVRLPTGPDEAA